MTKTKLNNVDIDSLIIKHGSHSSREDGCCLLEACAYAKGEDHTDHPSYIKSETGAESIFGALGRRANDALPEPREGA